MTYRFDVAHNPEVVARWCTLAEQRLAYLTELFQNGRWRRYYSHTAFLENIKEAKAMVAHWQALSTPGSSGTNKTAIGNADLTSAPALIVVDPAPREADLPPGGGAGLPDDRLRAPRVLKEMSPDSDPMQDRFALLRNLTL